MTTRKDLIQDVSHALDDLEVSTITSADDASHPADDTRTEPDSYWSGGWLSINGVERRITDWSYSDGGVWTTNAFPTVPEDGDEVEIRRHPRHRRTIIEKLINEAIRDVAPFVRVRVDSREDLSDTTVYDPDVKEYAVPAGITHVHEILWQYSTEHNPDDQTWYPLDLRDWVTYGTGTVGFTDIGRDKLTEDVKIKFLGTRAPVELSADDDVVEVPGNYLLYYTAARMCLRLAVANETEERIRQAQAFDAMALAARPATRMHLPSGSRRVR